jgi:hypothetical protein
MKVSATRSAVQRDDRVRAHTKPELNLRIDRGLERQIRLYAHADADLIAHRLEELDQEWDMERLLETNASALAFLGAALAATVSRKWLVMPMVITGFLFQHAVQGWCPPVPLFRRLGVRTRKEIERERYALKLLRGDFGDVAADKPADAETLAKLMDQ